MGNKCVQSSIVINTTINQLDSGIIKNNLLPEAICCCLYKYNVVASEVMVADTCSPNLAVIDITIKQLEINISLITIYCLRLFVVVYKDEML